MENLSVHPQKGCWVVNVLVARSKFSNMLLVVLQIILLGCFAYWFMCSSVMLFREATKGNWCFYKYSDSKDSISDMDELLPWT